MSTNVSKKEATSWIVGLTVGCVIAGYVVTHSSDDRTHAEIDHDKVQCAGYRLAVAVAHDHGDRDAEQDAFRKSLSVCR